MKMYKTHSTTTLPFFGHFQQISLWCFKIRKTMQTILTNNTENWLVLFPWWIWLLYCNHSSDRITYYCCLILLNLSMINNVMWSSKISRKSEILTLRYSQTKEVFPFVSFYFGNSLIADILSTGCSISMGFLQNVALQMLVTIQ